MKQEKQYNRVCLGSAGCYAKECRVEGYIGADFDINEDLTANLTDSYKPFGVIYVPKYLETHKEKSKTSAGLSCGFLWTICKGLRVGDVVLSPSGNGTYFVGTIVGDYYYEPDTNLPHRRKVQWLDVEIRRSDMSKDLKNSTGSIGTCCDVTKYAEEIEDLIANHKAFETEEEKSTAKSEVGTYKERDLHRIFANYCLSKNIYAKTIYHEQSLKSKDDHQKWVHPDMVGVCFSDFRSDKTDALQRAMEPHKAVQIFSFELKRTINNDYELKQYYFQALSNSSWANFGYLVAYEIDESLNEEIERLNAAFGIGVILLKAKPDDTRFLCMAREKEVDYVTVDKLCNMNPNFEDFISGLTKVLTVSKEFAQEVRAGFEKTCDKGFDDKDDKELEAYCMEKGIPY